jgi:acyl transferase domain-containing protein
LVAAYRDAGVPIESVSYVELHGTGTELGDPVEIDGLQRAFRRQATRPPTTGSCGVGTVKSNIGHLEPAAGIAGVLKVILAMRNATIPASLHIDQLNPHLRLDDGPFAPIRESRDWPGVEVRRAGVSSFGFGGVYAHVVLEEAPAQPEPAPSDPGPHVFVLSARTQDCLRRYASDMVAFLAGSGRDAAPTSIARTAQLGRVPMTARLAIVFDTTDELRATLADFLAGTTTLAALHTGVVAGQPETGWLAEPEGREYLATVMRNRNHHRLAQLWVDGADIDWRVLYSGATPLPANLPTYPFARERHWLRNAPALTTTPARDTRMLAKQWRPAPASTAIAELPSDGVLVLANPETAALARKLFDTNATVLTLTDADDADPATGATIAARLRAEPVTCVIDLIDVCAEPVDRASETWARIVIAQELVAGARSRGLRYLHCTRGLTTFEGARPTLRGAVFAGLVRMLSAEYRGVSASTVDLDPDACSLPRLREVIGRELAATDPVTEVCVRGGIRYLPTMIEVGEPANRIDWRVDLAGRAVVITGGAGALGRTIAADLIQQGANRIVLLGRRSVPERDEQVLAELRRPGVELRVLAGQLDDPGWIRAALADVRAEWGPIAGIVHCAGRSVQTNPAFVGKRVDEMREVLAAKVAGLQELVAACAADPLRFVVLCSSVSGLTPTLASGISDYAVANAFLDRFAEYQSAIGRTGVRSIQWPSWQSMGMPAVSTKAYQDLGLRTLPTDVGMRLLHRAMNAEQPVVLPCVVDTATFDPARLLTVRKATLPMAALPAAPGADRAVLRALTTLFANQLRLDESTVDPDVNFAELGVDSIMIAQLLATVEREFDRPVEPSAFLEHPTLNRFAGHLAGAGFAPVRESIVAPTEIAQPRPDVRSDAIAVIGIACHFPGAPDKDTFWRNLVGGTDSITEVPSSRWDVRRFYADQAQPGRSVSKWGGFLDAIEDFDPAYFGIAEDQAAQVDPLMRQFLEVCVECVADAGYQRTELAGRRVGVFAGARTSSFGANQAQSGLGSISGMAQNFIAAHVAHFLDLHGPNLVIDSACSSSLVSVHLAAQSLRTGECELALAGGVEILLDEIPFVGLSEGGALSPTGRCRAFGADADGIVLGEGAGVLLLKRLDHALRDGDRIYAVLDGGAINNDGRTMGITTPNPAAQRDVIQQALAAADCVAADIGYVETHGTGTMIGDPMELKALTEVFRLSTTDTGRCGVGSVKSNIGHLLSAAGIAGLIKVILAIQHRTLPPTLHCAATNPRFRFEDSPLFPVREAGDWPGADRPRRAGVSSFGFGGTNAHLIVRELVEEHDPRRAPLPPIRFDRRRWWFDPVVPTARTPELLSTTGNGKANGGGARPFFELRF